MQEYTSVMAVQKPKQFELRFPEIFWSYYFQDMKPCNFGFAHVYCCVVSHRHHFTLVVPRMRIQCRTIMKDAQSRAKGVMKAQHSTRGAIWLS